MIISVTTLMLEELICAIVFHGVRNFHVTIKRHVNLRDSP